MAPTPASASPGLLLLALAVHRILHHFHWAEKEKTGAGNHAIDRPVYVIDIIYDSIYELVLDRAV